MHNLIFFLVAARNYGRGNATLNWLSSFEAQEGDSTDFGYTLSWYQGHSKDPAGSVELKHSTLAKSFASDDHHVHDLSHTLPVMFNFTLLVLSYERKPSITLLVFIFRREPCFQTRATFFASTSSMAR